MTATSALVPTIQDVLDVLRGFGVTLGQVKDDVSDLKSDVKVLKSDVKVLKSDVKTLKSEMSEVQEEQERQSAKLDKIASLVTIHHSDTNVRLSILEKRQAITRV